MPHTVSKRENRWALQWALAIVALSCLPYLIAWRLTPGDTKYTGLLLNHLDGESYYAKMQQGARGDWLFHLTYTPEPHDGAFIFTFYLSLGHLAAALGLSIPLTYHLARAVASLFLLLVAYRFIGRFFARLRARRAAFLLLGFSAGFGWLLAPMGIITADLWVAEGFTFLSIFANPHFPLALGLMLLVFLTLLDQQEHQPTWQGGESRPSLAYRQHPGSRLRKASRLGAAAGLGLLLASIQPFAVPIVLVVSAVYLGTSLWQDRHPPWSKMFVVGATAVGAAPIMLYDLYVYRTHPALAEWSAQNVTPSLAPWNYALGYGLILILALGGVVVALHRRAQTDLFLVSWVGSVIVLLYLPFALQRRFITGLHIPLTLLAGLGLERIVWPRVRPYRRALVTSLIVGFTALTNLFVPMVAVIGVAQGRYPLVMSQDEAAAYVWLHEHTAWTDTVLVSPDSGHFVPAWAGNRVVYGHPFETIDAEGKRAEVTRFFSPDASTVERSAMLARYGVRYVIDASAETDLDPAELELVPTWESNDIILYRVGVAP